MSFRCSTSATSANTAIKSIEFSKRGRYVLMVDDNNADLYPLECVPMYNSIVYQWVCHTRTSSSKYDLKYCT